MKTRLNNLPLTLFRSADEEGRAGMSALVEAKGLTTSYTIGRSIEGRAIELYKIGEGRRRVAFFGTHHALESVTCNILYSIIYILSNGLGIALGGIDLPILRRLVTFYIVPCVNVDGVELHLHGPSCRYMQSRQLTMSDGDFSHWQANARGVDLNHNYDYGFMEYKRIEQEKGIAPGPTLYSGEYPESEPETRAVAAFLRALMPDAVISLHTQGEEIYHSSDVKGTALAAFLCRHTGYVVSKPVGTASYGGLCDYTATLEIPSITLEIGRGRNPLSNSSIFPALCLLAEPLLLLPTLLL